MTEEELRKIEWKLDDPDHGYGWEACDVYDGMRNDILTLIDEVRRLKVLEDAFRPVVVWPPLHEQYANWKKHDCRIENACWSWSSADAAPASPEPEAPRR